MAREYAHYDGAKGPEGVRRTVTFYGPVIGGLPILAWHCPTCGLLKLDYPDGRHEERRLFPGPQPGLLRLPSTDDPDVEEFGRQARVSGLSLSAELMHELAAQRSLPDGPPGVVGRAGAWITELGRQFYALSGWSQAAVVMLVATAVCLFTVGVLAAGGYETPVATIDFLLWVTGGFFCAFFVFLLAPAVFPLPALAPAVADSTSRETKLSTTTRTGICLMVIGALGALWAAVLAVADTATSPMEGLVVIGVLACFALAFILLVGEAIWNHRSQA